MKLENKVAVITGGGAGLGRSVAIRYAKEKAKVVVADINDKAGEETIALIKQNGGDAFFIKTDVKDEPSVMAMIEETVKKYGKLDILFNNAAVQLHKQDARVHELSTEVWDKTIEINFKSGFLCAKYAIAEMLKNGGGSVIFVGSPTGIIGCAPAYTAYSAAKGGLHALARVIASGYGKDKIRSNTIIPGTMNTTMITDIIADDKVKTELESAAMLGRLGNVNEIDGVAVFLASDDSSYCTGAFFTADGGLTA